MTKGIEATPLQPYTLLSPLEAVAEDAFYEAERRTSMGTNPLLYPLGFFGLQVDFARRWAILTDNDMPRALEEQTSIPRVLANSIDTGSAQQAIEIQSVLQDCRTDASVPDMAEKLFEVYAGQPQSSYQPPDYQFGAFTYTYRPDKAAQLHFANPVRGQSPFAADHMPQRKEEFARLVRDIHRRHTDAERFVAGSWIFVLPGFRTLFPKLALVEPPILSMTGDSLWGQFIDASGNTNPRAQRIFRRNLDRAQNLTDLRQAFPHKVLFTNERIEAYYEHYSITG